MVGGGSTSLFLLLLRFLCRVLTTKDTWVGAGEMAPLVRALAM